MWILSQSGSTLVCFDTSDYVYLNGMQEVMFKRSEELKPLGSYPSVDRAREVVKEIFNALKNGENSYSMPAE